MTLTLSKDKINLSDEQRNVINQYFDVDVVENDVSYVLSGEEHNVRDYVLQICDMDIDKANSLLEQPNKIFLVKASSKEDALQKIYDKINNDEDFRNALNLCFAFIENKGGFDGYDDAKQTILSIFKK